MTGPIRSGGTSTTSDSNGLFHHSVPFPQDDARFADRQLKSRDASFRSTPTGAKATARHTERLGPLFRHPHRYILLQFLGQARGDGGWSNTSPRDRPGATCSLRKPFLASAGRLPRGKGSRRFGIEIVSPIDTASAQRLPPRRRRWPLRPPCGPTCRRKTPLTLETPCRWLASAATRCPSTIFPERMRPIAIRPT